MQNRAEKRAHWLALAQQGKGVKAIARETGSDVQTVRYFLRDQGIDPLPTGIPGHAIHRLPGPAITNAIRVCEDAGVPWHVMSLLLEARQRLASEG